MSGRRVKLAAAVAALLGVAAVVVSGVVLAGGGEETQPAPGAAESEPEGGTVAAGPPAPRLAGTDLITGKKVSLGDFRGKPVVINVWASWCPGCIAEAADLKRFAEAHPEAVVLGIDTQDTISGAKAFYREWNWTHPSIFDPNGELTAKLGLLGLPSTYFLNDEHRLVTSIVGEGDFNGFEDGLEQAKRAS